MKSPLHILHLEDDPNDAVLVQSTLAAGGINCAINCVKNRDDFVAALEHGGIDLILSDSALPTWDGLSAAEIVRAKWPAIPLILVSGSKGEESAINFLKSGAKDYVLKEHLSRLVPVVRRAMEEVTERVGNIQMKEALRASELRIIEDMAERRHLEAEFIEAQKMEVIGQLASSVAHDFNNIIGIIVGYSDLIAAEAGQDSQVLQHNEKIRHASERAVGLTRQLLIFSRKQTVQTVVLDLNDEIKDMDKMLRRLVAENIEITIVPVKQIGRIRADSGYIGQVLMNMVVNARDAMPNGGKLTIATNNVTLDEACGRTHADVIPGEYVMLSISDTGTGMTQEVKSHLFEAFFTTKPTGKGTGLGLATCHTIVQESGGHIGVESEPGKGTCFKIYFPRVELPIDAGSKIFLAGPLPRGTETLLVVEDEPALLLLACDVLEGQGYRVVRASNGLEGIKMAHEFKGQPIALVITDVIMPQMGGTAMAEWFRSTYPKIKVLFTSGYPDDVTAHQGVLDSGVAFLPKPYTPSTLARKVREILDAK